MEISSDSTVELKFVYTRDDYLAAIRAYDSHMPRQKWENISAIISAGSLIVAIIGLIVLGIMAIIRFHDWFIPTVGFALAIWFSIVFIKQRLIPSTVDFDQDPGWRRERQWKLNSDGLEIIGEQMNTKMKWSYFDRVLETDNTYLFFINKDYGIGWRFLPKRVFNSSSQELIFKNLVARNTHLKGLIH